MLITKVLEEYKNRGLFSNYCQEHILYPALNDIRPVLKNTDSGYIFTIKQMYDTFILNLNKIFIYLQEQYKTSTVEIIIKYLSCDPNYSNEEFLFRYTNLLVMCGIKSISTGLKDSDLSLYNNELIFWFEYNNGKRIQFYTEWIYTIYTDDDLKKKNVLELEVGLKRNDIEFLKATIKKENMNYRSSNIQKIINSLNDITKIPFDQNIFTICLLQLSNNYPNSYPISPVQGIFLNKHTGLFENDVLHNEYGFDELAFERLSGVLAINYNLQFLIYGNMHYILNGEDSFIAINNHVCNSYEENIEKLLYALHYKYDNNNCICIYNSCSSVAVETCQNLVGLLLKKYEKTTSTVFSSYDEIVLKEFINCMLHKYPQLLQPFEINIDYALDKIYACYERMYLLIQKKYPLGHPFKNKKFLLDGTGFGFAYCLFVVPIKMGNDDMMIDFLNKKLISSKDGKFNMKIFNENYSEFEIFFYLLIGIFCTSERYKTFLKLEYEPNGNINKRFEYAFVFKEYKINVEVKALECAPEFSDGIDLYKMNNGTRFYKNYFHANKDIEVIPSEVLDNTKKLKSNYRQVAKNIKKINDKCIIEDGVVNLGFLMINYGTSREEFISYLMHEKYGYLKKNTNNKLDALVLFSMCMNTDLMMNKILEEEHVFVFPNKELKDWSLLTDLRLSNYISDNIKNAYSMYFNDQYSEFVGIKEKGFVTFQKAGFSKNDLKQILNIIEEDNYIKNLIF